MPCDYKRQTEPYSAKAFNKAMRHQDQLKKTGMYPADNEAKVMEYIIKETKQFTMDVYDKENSTITVFFVGNPMGSSFLTSDRFAIDYGNSLYAFIQEVTEGFIDADDIGGIIIHRVD